MLKLQRIFPKLYRGLLYVVCHNLESQNAGLVDDKKDLNLKRSKDNLYAKIQKISIAIKKVTASEVTLTHKAERPSNYFFQLIHTLLG